MTTIPPPDAYQRRGLDNQACQRQRSGGGGTRGKVTHCTCAPCAVSRFIAVRRAGPWSDHPGAIVTRAVAENA